jgi:hypothetical protein
MGTTTKENAEMDWMLEYNFRGHPDDAGRPLGRRHGTIAVATLAEAVEEHDRLRDEAECGASGHIVANVHYRGRLVARISYNGRVWNAYDEDKEFTGRTLAMSLTDYQMAVN